MRSRRISLCCFLVAALAAPRALGLNPDEKPADYIAAHWDAEDGLPHNSVRRIFQTRDGFLWIGTMQGLARFDGLTFTNFTTHNTPALLGNQITSMAQTPDGTLWIGTSGGLVRYRDGRFTGFGPADGIKNVTVNALCVVPDGSLWIGDREGITRWVGGKFVKDVALPGYNLLTMREIFVDRQGAVWVVLGTDALRFKDGTLAHFGRAEGFPAQQLQMLCEDSADRVLAVTQSGLFRLENERFVAFEQNAALSSRRDTAALVDRAGNLWIGSVGGLDRFAQGRVLPYLDRAAGRLGAVDALFEDREGCLWVGTSNGLYRFTDRRGSTLSTEQGILGTSGLAVCESRDGSVWLSSWAGGVARLQNGTVRQYAGGGAPFSHESTTAIYEAPDGVMWFGNRGSAIDRLDGDKVTTFVYQPGVPTSRPVQSMFMADNNELLVGINRRGLVHLVDNKLVPVPEAAALADETVSIITRLRDGRLVAGTTLGLYERSADRNWNRLDLPGLKAPVIVNAIHEAPDGTRWLATSGHGLVRWNAAGEAHSYDSSVGMIDDILFSVTDDDLGSLWVSSARGLARIRKTDFDDIDDGTITTLDCMTFGRVDGLASGATPGGGFPTATLLKDGRLVTASAKGFAVVTPRNLQVNTQPPTLVIESVIADDRPLPVTPGKTTVVPAGTNRLEIRYTALSLIAPHRLRFRYHLQGSDPTWVEAGRERSARYTHLAPGSYTFRMLACNNDGVWNNAGVTLALSIQPLFYQTLWFRVATAVLVIALVGSYIRLRVRRYRLRQAALARANAELDQRVQARTAELSQTNAELQQRELLFRLIFEHAPVGIVWKRADLGTHYHVNSTFRRILDLPADNLPDYSRLTNMLQPDDVRRQAELDRQIESGGSDSYTVEQRYVRPDGTIVWGLLSVAVVRDAQGTIIQDIGILEDVTARKNAEKELADTYKNLVEVSRTAGMAEVATSVLHNVGNVLNSLNVSATVVAAGLRESKADSLARLSTLLNEHEADLGAFLTTDPRGRRVPEFLASLAEHSLAERDRLLGETRSLQQYVDHIKEIVSMQQAYATMVSIVEPLDPVTLMEDALRMNAGALVRHGLRVQREFRPTPPVVAEKAKVLQILINLIRNAKYACDDGGNSDKVITLSIESAVSDEKVRSSGAPDRVRLVVRDNGVGIPRENLTRIFAHGFTTRKTGHGFGLHSAANAAREMKGSLTVHSDGHGFGATFILELPALSEAMVSPHVPTDTAAPEPAGTSI